MKNYLPLFCLFLGLSLPLSAQDLVQVSYGPSYKNQTYYRLADDAVTSLDNNAWDIAFTTFGANDAGIHINESAVTFGAETVLFLAPTNNFNDPIDAADLDERLFNDEKTWDFGAFNSTRDINNPNDFGWGILNPGTGDIIGNTVFVVRFKNGAYQKLQINSLSQGVYSIKYANLDGSGLNTLTIDKADFPDSDFAYLNLASGQILPPISVDWDLAFLRYSSPNDDGTGGVIEIMSSGVLSAPGVQVAQADLVDPEEVEFSEFQDSLSGQIDIIGSDWKTFDNTAWLLADDRAYFVKTENGAIWKLIFLEFGGSSTGNVVFSKELVAESGVGEQSGFSDLVFYPNPTTESGNLIFSSNQSGTAQLSICNIFGHEVWSGNYEISFGLNAAQLSLKPLPAGHYFATLRLGEAVLTQKIVKQN